MADSEKDHKQIPPIKPFIPNLDKYIEELLGKTPDPKNRAIDNDTSEDESSSSTWDSLDKEINLLIEKEKLALQAYNKYHNDTKLTDPDPNRQQEVYQNLQEIRYKITELRNERDRLFKKAFSHEDAYRFELRRILGRKPTEEELENFMNSPDRPIFR